MPGRYSSCARYGASDRIGSATSGASPLRSAFALSTRPMISLLFMKVLGAGVGCWAKALDANTVARIVAATLYARMWVSSVVTSLVRTEGGLAEGVIRSPQQ